jgi:hypothetical protein
LITRVSVSGAPFFFTFRVASIFCSQFGVFFFFSEFIRHWIWLFGCGFFFRGSRISCCRSFFISSCIPTLFLHHSGDARIHGEAPQRGRAHVPSVPPGYHALFEVHQGTWRGDFRVRSRPNCRLPWLYLYFYKIIRSRFTFGLEFFS